MARTRPSRPSRPPTRSPTELRTLIETYGPRSVALYLGTNGLPYPASPLTANAFIRAIESPMFFTANTIDQPGKQVALAPHGHWLGGDVPFDEADSWLLVGTNPLISKAIGIPGQNPGQGLRTAISRGMKLIVIDPRRSQTAARAAIHIQPRPGEDVAILAGMINWIVRENLCDTEFLAENVTGFDELAAAVSAFTPEYVAERADVPAEEVIEAARLFATFGTRGGMVNAGTGANFSAHGTLLEYLCLCLTTICGRWQRAGGRVTRPNTLMPAYTAKAQAHPPYEGWGFGEHLRVRGLTDTAAGMPTAALADEILLEGDGQVKALICVGGNPMAAWPDQRKTHRALQVSGSARHAGHRDVTDLAARPLRHRAHDADGDPGHDPGRRTDQVLRQRRRDSGGLRAVRAAPGRSTRGLRPGGGMAVLPRPGQTHGPTDVLRQLLRRRRRQIHGVPAGGGHHGRRHRTHDRGTVRGDVRELPHSSRRGGQPSARQHLRY